MREFEQHLSPDLFHRLVEAGETEQRAPELESAAQHVAACAVCRQRLGKYQKAQRGLEDLKLKISEERMKTPGCPPESEWASLAAGLLDGAETGARVDHAARCAFCGPLLREAMEDLATEASDEERRVLRLLPSAQAENQQRLAARLASADSTAGRGPASRRLWAWGIAGAVAAALALAAILLYGHLANPYNSAEKLLAQAYTSNRELDLRIPGAAYAPMSTVRGANASQPLPLLRAEVLIDRQLAAHPQSAAWIALQGRAQLLQGNFDAARSTLQQALRLQPNSPAILTDLATAEYALSEQEGRSEESMAAAEHLSEALKLRPDDPVALYNRALVYESIGSLPLALKDWERYLSLDPSSGWTTNVAREHLDRLKKRLGSSPQSELPPSDPAAAAAWLANRLKQPAPPAGTLGSADEQLLDVAVTRWLPDAYAATAAPGAQRQAERTALDRLAKELIRRHGDHWLADVLATPRSPSLAPGLAALAKAVRLNEEGRVDQGGKQAALAAKLLQAAHSPAAIRAETELAYAYQREADESGRCLQAVRSTLRELGRRPYPWIEAQILLERGSCENVQWHLGASRRAMTQASVISRSNGYGVLYLRAVGFLAEFAGVVGNDRESWQGNRSGLQEFWTRSYPPMRASQFYADMVFGAEDAGDWPMAEGLAQETVDMMARTGNRPMEAAARFRLATIADLAGDANTARKEFERAARIFASLPPDPTVESYRADAQIHLADLEVQTGHPRGALARLLRIRGMVGEASEGGSISGYFRALGEAYLATGDVSSAESALLEAVAIAEHGLYSLKNASHRVSWAAWYAKVYRGLVRAELKGRNDPTAALAVWEWYRSGPVRSEQIPSNDPVSFLPPTVIKSSAPADARNVAAFRAGVEKWLKAKLADLGNRSVVSYAEFSDGIEIWALDNRGVQPHWVAVPQPEFDRVAQRFGEECADPKSNIANLKSDGRQLYDWLIGPIESQLVQGRVVTFETDGSLARIPLQALVDARGEYLGDRVAIVISPGLAYEHALRPSPKFSPADRVLSIGAPALGAEWQSILAPLPEADDEARTVAASFRSATMLTGRQATVRAVLHDLPQAVIFHFAGHALAGGKRIGLLLSAGDSESKAGDDADVLAASQLNAGDLRECRLAVLSACSTAAGDGTALVNPGSLVGEFLLAGVPDVVASNWDVEFQGHHATDDRFLQEPARRRFGPIGPSTSRRIGAGESGDRSSLFLGRVQRLREQLKVVRGAEGDRMRRRWVWIILAGVASILFATFIWVRSANPPASAKKLLAQAYTANRVLKLRIPGADYAPMSTERGASLSRSLPLLRAEVLIRRQLEAHPSNVTWVALDGRAQLLEGQFDEARATLWQALRLDPNSPAILTDLATADYELATEEGHDEEYMAAAEHLLEALKQRPRDAVALYNLALVYERIGSLPLAVKDWQAYLKFDPASVWANKVARANLDRAERRVDSSLKDVQVPSDPAAAAAWLAKRLKQPAPPAGTTDSADEQLLNVAVKRWLPDEYSANGGAKAKEEAERTAVDRLAQELVKRHGDHWLEDVLAVPRSPSLASGLAALAQAVRHDDAGRPDEAEKQAIRAAEFLHAAHSPAALRAETELAYAYQREASKASRCVDTAQSALRESGGHPYPWIEAQLLLEQASCEGMLRRLGASRRAMEQSVEVSRSSGYGVLYLRGIGFFAANEGELNDYRKAWQEDRIGLGAYWSGHYPPVRAYQFYSDMTFGAEATGDWWVAEGLAQEGVDAIAQTPNRPVEAMARFRLATLADLAGDRETARDQFRAAAKIFASLPPDPTLDTYQAYVQVYLADLEVQTGTPQRAQQRLLKTEALVRRANNDELGLRFYRGLGEAYLSEGDVSSAESSLLKAVAIAERGLHSLKSGAERVSWAETTADAYRGLVRTELKGRDDPTAGLGVWEWYRSSPVRAQQIHENGPVSRLLPVSEKSIAISDASVASAFRIELERWMRDARPELRGETVVSYAQFPDGIEIWAFDDRGITSHWVAVPQAEFERVARQFGQECADPKSSLALLQSDGHQLYEWLIAPVESRLSANRVLAFETDGAVSGIPLQALVDGDDKYLGDRFAVVFSPGLGYARLLRRKTNVRSSDRALAIGAPALGGEWQSMFSPLPEADAEARAVAASFRSATLLTGGQATLPEVLHDLPETQIFHFAGHAMAEGKRTGLVLADADGPRSGDPEGAGVLAATELNAQNLRECRLAVLSACSTAGGEDAALVDPGSLVGAFLLAGVPDVVASRWNVNSTATTSLMRVFYQRLLAGDSVARALERASEAVRRQPETAHPYFWAAFSAYGR